MWGDFCLFSAVADRIACLCLPSRDEGIQSACALVASSSAERAKRCIASERFEEGVSIVPREERIYRLARSLGVARSKQNERAAIPT